MEHKIYSFHCIFERAPVTDVTDVEINLVGNFRHPCLKIVTHIVLSILVAGENADFSNICTKEAV